MFSSKDSRVNLRGEEVEMLEDGLIAWGRRKSEFWYQNFVANRRCH